MTHASLLIVGVAAGILLWTWLEYALHRWWGHHRRWRWTLFAREHTRHHVEGDYFAPTWLKMLSTAVFAAAAWWPTTWLLGPWLGGGTICGVVLGYAVWEWLHRRSHTCAARNAYGRWMRRYHLSHHLVHAKANYGVTSPFWDRLLRTYRAPGEAMARAAHVMPWLVDPATGDIRADYAEAYVVRRRPRSTA